MRQRIHGRTFRQVRRMQYHFLQEPDLCLGRLLPHPQVAEALSRQGVVFRDCLYTPVVTLWTFLYQVLCPDPSCRAAVAHLLAFLAVRGQPGANADTGPYCKARERLPEALVADLARESAVKLQARCPATELLKGRPIKIADGTTVSMPDTPENQKRYPQQPNQKPGLGFPIIRLVAVISLSCGALLDVAMGAYAGKKTGETALLRKLFDQFQGGDVVLADAIFANYWTLAALLAKGVDLVARRDGKRLLDWRAGKRLGRKDHRVLWHKPARPYWMSRAEYQRMPQTLMIRELAVAVGQPGFRTRQVVMVTTLLDEQVYPSQQIAAAYRARWHAELDLRSIKQVMAMEVLRCKTPAMVHKEIWMHILAYNLIRTLLAEAAGAAGVQPRELSFKGALQTLNAFAAVWPFSGNTRAALYATLLKTIARHRVADRPNRVQPRAVKRRPRKQVFLTEPRSIARNRLLTKT
jgi:Transposase DDE domain